MKNRLAQICEQLQRVADEAEQTEAEHTVWRTKRNQRALTLLRALELFGGNNCCPVCGSPPKWQPDKKPTDRQRQDLLTSPGMW